MSTTDFDTLFKGNFIYLTQLFLFYGIFIAFAVKTPTIFLNTWLLKAHVESPLGGSIILAAIVLKLSLYGILRLILPVLPKAYMEYTYIIFLIGVITIVYASLSTLRTTDVKELIAYSSVSHAAVYLLGVFSNSIQGIEGAINLGLAHGLVSPGLFICAGGVLYDRSSTRVISFYRGVTQVMPLFAILFFILCLANCGAPLSLNFIGEFLSLYGVFERSSLFGIFASSSIIFSAAYTIYMYQRIAFGGSYSRMFTFSTPDLTKREFTILLVLVIPTVLFGIYPAPILDAIHYSVSTLIYCFDFNVISCDASRAWGPYFQDSTILQVDSLVDLHDNIVYCLVTTLFAINWIQITMEKSPISYKYLNESIWNRIWKITPALILVLIAFPSFKLLYLMNEVTDPSLSVLAEDYQWYWSYEYPDFLNSDGDFVEFDSYLVPKSDLEDRALSMLVSNRVILNNIISNIPCFKVVLCSSPSNVIDEFKGLDLVVVSRTSDVDLYFSKLDQIIHNLKSNMEDVTEDRISTIESNLQDNMAELRVLQREAYEKYMPEWRRLFLTFVQQYKFEGYEDIRPVLDKVKELSEKDFPMPTRDLFKSDPATYWKEMVRFTNRDHNRTIHILNLFKEYAKDKEAFTLFQKESVFRTVNILKRTATDISSTYKLLYNTSIPESKILTELRNIRSK